MEAPKGSQRLSRPPVQRYDQCLEVMRLTIVPADSKVVSNRVSNFTGFSSSLHTFLRFTAPVLGMAVDGPSLRLRSESLREKDLKGHNSNLRFKTKNTKKLTELVDALLAAKYPKEYLKYLLGYEGFQ